MSEKLKGLRDKRGKAVAEMRSITETADREKRALTAEELNKHSALFDETERLRLEIQAEEREVELKREEAATAGSTARAGATAATASARWNEFIDAAPRYLRDRLSGLDQTVEIRRMSAFRPWLSRGSIGAEGAEEFRALQSGADTQGGFLVVPEQFVAMLLKAVDDQVFIRRRATVIPVANADSLGVPSLDADPADADWTTELATGNEDSAMAFGKRKLEPHPLAKRIKVSNDLLRRALFSPETLVRDRMAYKFGVSEEKAYLIGTGAQQPLGIYTASNDGVPTSRDVSSGNTATDIQFDGLIEAKYSLKSQYWPMAVWNFSREAVKRISKLKDGNGQYLWRPSVRDGEPDRLLDFPVDVSEYTPATFTTGLYVGALADWSHYWIADAMNLQMQRLSELYAITNQTGFIARKETDGMPVLAEAFVRVKLA